MTITKTTILDTHWTGRPRSIAAVLIASDGKFAVLDPGPASTLPTLHEHLRTYGIGVADLGAILLTHIHLDHAGAAGSMVRENPRLQVFVHSLGAPHMADPTKLLKSAGRLYGEHMDRLYGEFLPVPQENLHTLEGGETVTIGSRQFDVLYTPGHASHHVTYLDQTDGTAFVGDTAGICIEGNSFILPATPPPDINLEIWNSSLDAIAARKPARLFLTHFGFSNDPAAHLARYREEMSRWGALTQKLLANSQDEATAARAFIETITGEVSRTLNGEGAAQYIFNGGLQLSWLGLARYHRKRATT